MSKSVSLCNKGKMYMEKRMKICLKYEQFIEKNPMEDVISVNYSKITNCDQKICYLETSLFKIKNLKSEVAFCVFLHIYILELN